MIKKQLLGLMIAHRGIYKDNIIENSCPAFLMALEKNIPIELDVQLLKDGELVVFHDQNTKRLLGVNYRLAELSYEELKKYPFIGTQETVPTLKEVLTLVSGKVLIDIEIKKSKSPRKVSQKVAELLEYYTGDILITSFDIRIIHWFKKNTNYLTGLLLTEKSHGIYHLYQRLLHQPWLLRSLLKIDCLAYDYHYIDSIFVKKMKKLGIPIFVWTIHNQKELQRARKYADSFIAQDIF